MPDISQSGYAMAGLVLGVDAAGWTTASITTTSRIPCDDNVVTVSLTPDIKVNTFCVDKLTILGLVGSTTSDSAGSNFDTSDVGVSFFTWDRLNGELVVSLGTKPS